MSQQYKCYRDDFTLAEYEQRRRFFWAMPNAWGSADTPILRQLWNHEATRAAISLVPVLGLVAHAGFAEEYFLSAQEMARLVGRAAETVARGADVLAEMGLATRTISFRRGQRLSVWHVDPSIAARRDGSFQEEYFFFSASIIYGGQWRELTDAQRALYLAVATQVRSYSEESVEPFVRSALPWGTDMADLKVCQYNNRNSGVDWGLRLAWPTHAELGDILGMATPSVSKAANGFKPQPLFSSGVAADRATYLPIWAYPTREGTLLYHVRDHVDPMPWIAGLSGAVKSAASPAATDLVDGGDDDIPF